MSEAPASERRAKTSSASGMSGLRGWSRDNPDLLVIGAWWLVLAVTALSRKDFAGDGVRHLPAVLGSGHPPLGEPRWLLFPGLVFVLLRPLVGLGLVSTFEGLTRPMVIATLIAAAVYMLGVRACLRALGAAPGRRAAALALAGSLACLLFPASDLLEPIFGAAVAMCGLAFAARHAAPPVGPEETRRAVVVAVAAIAAGGLLYQGVVFSLALIPSVVPVRALWDRRTIGWSAAIVALVPIVVVGALMLSGNGLHHAWERFARGEENALYRAYLHKPGLKPWLVGLVTGPPQAVVALPATFRGWSRVLVDLRDPAHRAQTIALIARAGAGFAVLAAGVWFAARRRQFALLGGLGVLLLLPLVRQQPGYMKFYVFMPLVVAIVAARAPVPLIAGLAAAVFIANVVPLWSAVAADRTTYFERKVAYAKADSRSCWLAGGWAAPLPFLWPGSVCPILGSLAGGTGEQSQTVIAGGRSAMDRCLEDCFCRATDVFTDDMTDVGAPLVTDVARWFDYHDRDLTTLTIPVARAEVITAGARPVYRYPERDQERLCALVSKR